MLGGPRVNLYETRIRLGLLEATTGPNAGSAAGERVLQDAEEKFQQRELDADHSFWYGAEAQELECNDWIIVAAPNIGLPNELQAPASPSEGALTSALVPVKAALAAAMMIAISISRLPRSKGTRDICMCPSVLAE